MRESSAGFIELLDGALEVVAQPKIVMPQIGNELTFRFLQSPVVRSGLMARIAWKINPSDTRIFDGRNDLLRVIRAPVTDDEKLEVLHGLPKHAVDCVRQNCAPVVSRNDHRYARRSGHAAARRARSEAVGVQSLAVARRAAVDHRNARRDPGNCRWQPRNADVAARRTRLV